MLIKVTQKHIDKSNKLFREAKGFCSRCYNCPIALALQEQVHPDCWNDFYSIHIPDSAKLHPLPKEACDFVHKYDNGIKVAPFEFDLEGV